LATLQYSEPAIFGAESQVSPNAYSYPAAAGHTGTSVINRGDLVLLTSTSVGTLLRAATNSATLVAGLAVHGEQAVWNSSTTGVAIGGAGLQNLFGAASVTNNTTIGLLPGDVGNVHVYKLLADQLIEINLSNTTGWLTGGTQQASYGTTGGILLDATSNLFVFDPTQSNKIMTVYAKVDGPNRGTVGDLGARVLVYFNGGVV
jgi:hypothetical protein